MRFLYFVLSLSCVLALPVTAQNAVNSGSIYSRLGLGELADGMSSQAAGMGKAGIALPPYASIGLNNPALLANQELVRISTGANLTATHVKDASGTTANLSDVTFRGLQVSLPLLNRRLGVGAGFQPYTRSNYYLRNEGQLVSPEFPTDTTNYVVNLLGEGGLHEAQIGLGWQITPWLALGASGKAVFGVIENVRLVQYDNPNGLTDETRLTQRDRHWGFTTNLGALVTARNVLTQQDRLLFGAALTLPANLQSRRTLTAGVSLDQDTLRTVQSGSARIPIQTTVGIAYVPNTSWEFAFDVRYEAWGSFESDLPLVGYIPNDPANQLNDRLRIGGGFQVLPAGNRFDTPFFARTAYRFGGFVDNGYVSINGNRVSTIAATGGLSLPGFIQSTRFDLGFELGVRGNTDNGMVRDLYFVSSVTINFGERWFIRRRFG